jgi:hypothetical protein
MQLFIPSVITIVIAAMLAFLVIPRTGALILAGVSLLAIIAVGIHHYNLFYSEYMLSTWQNGIGANASFLVLGLAIVFIISSILFMFTGGAGASANKATDAVNSVQDALSAPFENLSESVKNVVNATPANALNTGATGFFNKGLAAVTGAANAFKNAASNVATNATNVVKNNALKVSPMIPGLGFRASEV